MAENLTFTMIKPTAFKNNHTGAILKMINDAGFVIKAMKITHLSAETAGAFYEIHKGKPFYETLVQFMSSGPIVAAVLEKENAVEDYRTLIGATNPADAALVVQLSGCASFASPTFPVQLSKSAFHPLIPHFNACASS